MRAPLQLAAVRPHGSHAIKEPISPRHVPSDQTINMRRSSRARSCEPHHGRIKAPGLQQQPQSRPESSLPAQRRPGRPHARSRHGPLWRTEGKHCAAGVALMTHLSGHTGSLGVALMSLRDDHYKTVMKMISVSFIVVRRRE